MENVSKKISEPQDEKIEEFSEDTTPKDTEKNITVPIKFNKQTKNLSLDEASTLAQKGMKFDMISADFERFKKMAADNGHSVSEFLNLLEKQQNDMRKKELLEKCGGDEKFAEHVFKLESNPAPAQKDGFEELKEKFPGIRELSQIPEKVIERSDTKGTSLLDEYLRYRLEKQRESEASAKSINAAANSSIGSQKEAASAAYDPAKAEFLRGLWGR